MRAESLADAVAKANVHAPTRGNRRLERFLAAVNDDERVRAWWYMAQLTSERLSMSDHSWVHVQVVLNIALRLLRLLVKGGIEPAMVSDHGMKDRDERRERMLAMLEAGRAEGDELRRLPDQVWKALGECGVLRSLQPARWGGGEIHLAVVEQLDTVGQQLLERHVSTPPRR